RGPSPEHLAEAITAQSSGTRAGVRLYGLAVTYPGGPVQGFDEIQLTRQTRRQVRVGGQQRLPVRRRPGVELVQVALRKLFHQVVGFCWLRRGVGAFLRAHRKPSSSRPSRCLLTL